MSEHAARGGAVTLLVIKRYTWCRLFHRGWRTHTGPRGWMRATCSACRDLPATWPRPNPPAHPDTPGPNTDNLTT